AHRARDHERRDDVNHHEHRGLPGARPQERAHAAVDAGRHRQPRIRIAELVRQHASDGGGHERGDRAFIEPRLLQPSAPQCANSPAFSETIARPPDGNSASVGGLVSCAGNGPSFTPVLPATPTTVVTAPEAASMWRMTSFSESAT